MKKLNFSKMVASGNDFVVTDAKLSGNLSSIAKSLCDRKFGIGADGMLLLSKAQKGSMRMRIFNADGSEAEMCGNGARCSALYAREHSMVRVSKFTIKTKAGLIEAQIQNNSIRVRLTDPKDLKTDIPLNLNNRRIRANFINTGVPHTVIFVEGLNKINAFDLGRQIRNHKNFFPAGTNVNFVEILSKDAIAIRTYERGVEDETLACGTGSTASALIFALKTNARGMVNVHTKSKEVLKVYFDRAGANFKNVWLEGKAREVFKGQVFL